MEKENRGKVVNLNEFYAITGIAPSTVRNKLVNEGMAGVESGSGRGDGWKINTRLAINWLIDRKARELSGVEDDEDGEEVIFDEDRRLKRLRGDKIELELARDRAEVIPIGLSAGVIREIALFLGKSLDGLASTTADELSEIDDPAEIKKVLLDYVRKLRSEIVERTKKRLSDIRGEIF